MSHLWLVDKDVTSCNTGHNIMLKLSRRQNWTDSIAFCKWMQVIHLTCCCNIVLVAFPFCKEAENKAMRSVTRMQATVWHRGGRGFVGSWSIAHSPTKQMAKLSHSSPHPGSCAGDACKALFWAHVQHMFVQHFELYRTIELFWDVNLILFDTLQAHQVCLRSLGILYLWRSTSPLRAKCQAKSPTPFGEAMHGTKLGRWHDDVMCRWDLVKNVLQSLNIENWDDMKRYAYNYIQFCSQCIRATSNCSMDAMDKRHKKKQTNKQTNERTNKQTNKQINKQTNKQTN